MSSIYLDNGSIFSIWKPPNSISEPIELLHSTRSGESNLFVGFSACWKRARVYTFIFRLLRRSQFYGIKIIDIGTLPNWMEIKIVENSFHMSKNVDYSFSTCSLCHTTIKFASMAAGMSEILNQPFNINFYSISQEKLNINIISISKYTNPHRWSTCADCAYINTNNTHIFCHIYYIWWNITTAIENSLHHCVISTDSWLYCIVRSHAIISFLLMLLLVVLVFVSSPINLNVTKEGIKIQ